MIYVGSKQKKSRVSSSRCSGVPRVGGGHINSIELQGRRFTLTVGPILVRPTLNAEGTTRHQSGQALRPEWPSGNNGSYILDRILPFSGIIQREGASALMLQDPGRLKRVKLDLVKVKNRRQQLLAADVVIPFGR